MLKFLSEITSPNCDSVFFERSNELISSPHTSFTLVYASFANGPIEVGSRHVFPGNDREPSEIQTSSLAMSTNPTQNCSTFRGPLQVIKYLITPGVADPWHRGLRASRAAGGYRKEADENC